MKGRMAKTIKEIAAECGVPEQAVRGWCRRNHVAKDAKGSFAISESQKTVIYQHYWGVERKQVLKPRSMSGGSSTRKGVRRTATEIPDLTRKRSASGGTVIRLRCGRRTTTW